MIRRRGRLLAFVWVAGVACLATDCDKAQGRGQRNPVSELPRFSGWQKLRDAPVIEAGDLLERGLWNDPSVLRLGPQYVMYATSSTKEMFKPPVLPFRLVSANGTDWKLEPGTPLLDPATAGFASCETPSVVFFDGRYHMFYTGVQGEIKEGTPPPEMAIGHAISEDGIRWRPDPPGPVVRATGNVGDWNGYLVGEPGAVVFNNRIYVYFSAVGARPGGHPPQRHVLALATTTDGRSFEAPKEVLVQADLYPPERGFAGYSTPFAAVNQGKLYLFYDVVLGEPKWEQVALHFAVSGDGVQFRQARAPILTREALSWTSSEIRSPSVLFEDSRVRMWFAGHGDVGKLVSALRGGRKSPEFGIGYAETDVVSLERALDPGVES